LGPGRSWHACSSGPPPFLGGGIRTFSLLDRGWIIGWAQPRHRRCSCRRPGEQLRPLIRSARCSYAVVRVQAQPLQSGASRGLRLVVTPQPETSRMDPARHRRRNSRGRAHRAHRSMTPRADGLPRRRARAGWPPAQVHPFAGRGPPDLLGFRLDSSLAGSAASFQPSSTLGLSLVPAAGRSASPHPGWCTARRLCRSMAAARSADERVEGRASPGLVGQSGASEGEGARMTRRTAQVAGLRWSPRSRVASVKLSRLPEKMDVRHR